MVPNPPVIANLKNCCNDSFMHIKRIRQASARAFTRNDGGIFEVPCFRSGNTMGTSATVQPRDRVLYFISS